MPYAANAVQGPMALNPGGDASARHFEPNYALQAAREALGAPDGLAHGHKSNLSLGHTPSACFDDAGAATLLSAQLEQPRVSELGGKTNEIQVPAGAVHDQDQQATGWLTESQQRDAGTVLERQVPSPSLASQPEPLHNTSIPEHIDFDTFVHDPRKVDDYDDEEELELMAKREMDEDEVLDFSRRLPPKPPAAHTAQLPPFGAPQAEASGAALPSKCRVPKMSRAEASHRQRLERRDLLVDCILHDDLPGRSLTPRRVPAPPGRSRSSSRGPPREPRSKSTPRGEPLSAGLLPPAAPRRQPPSPRSIEVTRTEERPNLPLLPPLEAPHRPERTPRVLKASGSQSARAWRGRAAAGLYG